MRYLFYAIALAALVIGGWNTAELMKRQQTATSISGPTEAPGTANLEGRLANIENSILELAAQSGEPARPSGSADLENRIRELENKAANTPSGFDATQLFEGMAELAAKVQALENNPAASSPPSNPQPFDPSELFAGLAEINDRIGKLEQNPAPGGSSQALETLQSRIAALEEQGQVTPTPFDADALFAGVAELSNRIATLENRVANGVAPSSAPPAQSAQTGPDTETLNRLEALGKRVASLENRPAPQKLDPPDELLAGMLEISQRLSALESRDSQTLDQQALAEIGQRLENQAGQIAALEASQSATGPGALSDSTLQSLQQRLDRLEQTAQTDNSQTDQNDLLAGILEINQRISALENRKPQSTDLQAMVEFGEQLQRQSDAIATLKSDLDRARQNPANEEAVSALSQRLDRLENAAPTNGANADQDQLLSGMIELSNKVSRLEDLANTAKSDQEQTERKLDDQAKEIALLQQSGQAAAASAPIAEFAQGLDVLEARLSALESRPTSSSPPDLVTKVEALSDRLDQLQRQAEPADQTTLLSDQLDAMARRLQVLETQSEKKAPAVASVPEELLAGLQNLANRLDVIERQSKSGVEDAALNEAIETLADRLQTLENGAGDRNAAVRLELQTAMAALTERVAAMETRAPSTPPDLLENLTSLTGRVAALEKSSTNPNPLQTGEDLKAQLNALSNEVEKLAQAPGIRATANDEILAGMTELAARITALEAAPAKSNSDQIDGDALFEGMATLAHRISQLEEKLK